MTDKIAPAPKNRTPLQRIIQRLRDWHIHAGSGQHRDAELTAPDFTAFASVKRIIDGANEPFIVTFGFRMPDNHVEEDLSVWREETRLSGLEIFRALTYPEMHGLTVEWDGLFDKPIVIKVVEED
jgi:hypothetical protein